MRVDREVWVFGYGSLIWRVDFPFIERRAAALTGYARRFWQGSHDHRGHPDAPGRVLTLTAADAVCRGMAYRVEPDVFAHLDHREKNGYERLAIELGFDDGTTAPAVTYFAAPGNHAFLGPATAEEIARHIAASAGPSGSNAEYLLELAGALRAIGCVDEHVFELERLVKEIDQSREEN